MYKHLLLAIDLADAEAQHKAVQSAIACCRSFGAQLSVITVVPDFGMSMVAGFFPKNYQQNALKETDKALKAYAEKHFPEDIQVHRIVAHGTIYREIIFHAEQCGCDLIVMASHRPELEDYLLGPNAARVVRHAKASVLVVRD
ncbi:MAG TPA: universal stress protein [Kiloniellales bacterium]|mgnify:FL=1|jgi:nucleotide-binding universal stress UspA family protein|nr:universal stress protein [Kiloniellales bacterium]